MNEPHAITIAITYTHMGVLWVSFIWLWTVWYVWDIFNSLKKFHKRLGETQAKTEAQINHVYENYKSVVEEYTP